MPSAKGGRGKKYFTLAEANKMLPLVRAVVTDITTLAAEVTERSERLRRALPAERGVNGPAYLEELREVEADLERGRQKMAEYEEELRRLGVELKDYRMGLIDFPCRMGGREVYLCWRLGEPEVAHWHEIDAGFAGRQKLMVGAGG